MTAHDAMQALRDFQTLVVGLIGFMGVAATLAWNAHLSRDLQRRIIRHDTEAIRRALLEELKVQREALETARSTLQETIDKNAKLDPKERSTGMLPLHRYTSIFDSSIEKVGLLRPEEISAVIRAYLRVRTITSRLELLTLMYPAGGELAPAGWCAVHSDVMEIAQGIHEGAIPEITSAIDALQARAPYRDQR